MVVLIDTSSACSAVACLMPDGRVVAEKVAESGRSFDVRGAVAEVLTEPLTAIGVATGPGSFTGLRSGVSFAVGLAMARHIPLRGVRTLEVARARSSAPATGVAEAGRGRVYFLTPSGQAGLVAPAEMPRDWPVVGWLRETTRTALAGEGLEVLEEGDLRTFGAAAWSVYEAASELPYARVELEYMQDVEWGSS